MGTIGDFEPMADDITDTGPTLEGLTNNPPTEGSSNDMSYTADFTAYYELTAMPAIYIEPPLTNVWINFGNVNFSLSSHSCATNGVTWSIMPEGLTNGATLTGYPSNAVVNVGSVATSYVVRATANENTNIYGDAVLNVVELKTIELVSGATSNNVIPPYTWATVKNTNSTPQYVVVRAELNPAIAESGLSTNFITWSGGESVTNHPFQRKVSKQNAAHTQVIATCGEMNATGDVWVIWADLEIRMTGTTWDTPNSARFEDEYDETEDLGIKLYNYHLTGDTNIISRGAVGKVIPIGKLQPAGINEITTNSWTIERHKWRHDFKDGAVWTQRWDNAWTPDTTDYEPFMKFNPDNSNQIYDLDSPTIAKYQGLSGYVTDSCERYNHFRQWVAWNGEKCSDYSLWFWFARWKYTNDPNTDLQIAYTNLGTGNPEFPPNVPVYSPP